ncbi:hypothetical protein OPKNFCMD_4526 [Methylobacterium crusticola]|uniref:DUF2913 family protein n=2 Tax=Methylobacterium crusticola TaxID=1697972 RepID=A0ABQ4R2I8_9HYPH|nr:hypothetical protein OPKNFCMD_4526 [Methylobacterium crusticola]
MDSEWQKARLEELWTEVVLAQANDARLAIDQPPELIVIRLLGNLRERYLKAIDESNDTEARRALAIGHLAWQLLSLEVADWLTDIGPPWPLADREFWRGDEINERFALSLTINRQLNAAPLLHQQAIDLVALMLPRWLLENLINALEALSHGEVHKLVAPTHIGKHNDAWSWEKMRLRAVQHVNFLSGQGIIKKVALKRVSVATGIGEGTLRQWETAFVKDVAANLSVDWAKKSGNLKTILEDNPRYGENDGNSVDGYAYNLLLDLREESLTQFGIRYRERFGSRHNQDPSAGN